MRKVVSIFAALCLLSAAAFAQADKSDVRAGNRLFRKGDFKESEISYRKALIKDSTSIAANYNLASSLYRQQDYQGAKAAIDKAAAEASPAPCHFNSGDIALQLKDYQGAVDAFRSYLLQHPEDLEAKENYIYAKQMLKNQQNQQDQNQQNNDDQNQQDDQNQDNKPKQDPKQDPQDDPKQDPQQQPQDPQDPDDSPQQEPKISPQQAQQMLNAIQAREKETQDKVDKQKAALLQSKQKDKNW